MEEEEERGGGAADGRRWDNQPGQVNKQTNKKQKKTNDNKTNKQQKIKQTKKEKKQTRWENQPGERRRWEEQRQLGISLQLERGQVVLDPITVAFAVEISHNLYFFLFLERQGDQQPSAASSHVHVGSE